MNIDINKNLNCQHIAISQQKHCARIRKIPLTFESADWRNIRFIEVRVRRLDDELNNKIHVTPLRC